MAKIGINETQFAFTFFYQLANFLRMEGIRFYLPSLREEGDSKFKWAGTDLVINESIFIQFKMTDYFKSNYPGKEVREGLLPKEFAPYYRFNVKNEPDSNQFNALQSLAQCFPKAVTCYVAPYFHNQEGFWRFFEQPASMALEQFVKAIHFRQFVEPTVLELSEDNSHRICYSENDEISTGFLLSDPQEIVVESGLSVFSGFSIDESIIVDHGYLEKLLLVGTNTLFSLKRNQDIGYLIRKVQTQLLNFSNIFWLPLIKV